MPIIDLSDQRVIDRRAALISMDSYEERMTALALRYAFVTGRIKHKKEFNQKIEEGIISQLLYANSERLGIKLFKVGTPLSLFSDKNFLTVIADNLVSFAFIKPNDYRNILYSINAQSIGVMFDVLCAKNQKSYSKLYHSRLKNDTGNSDALYRKWLRITHEERVQEFNSIFSLFADNPNIPAELLLELTQ